MRTASFSEVRLERLNREQEHFLRQLIAIDADYRRRRGVDGDGHPLKTVGDWIDDALDRESFSAQRRDGTFVHEESQAFRDLWGLCDELADRGLLAFTKLPRSSRRFTGLTSSGRSYFSDLRRSRVSTWGPAVAGGVLGIVGVVVGWFLGRLG